MTWTLLVVILAASGAPTIDTTMKFVDGPSCQSAKPAVSDVMRVAGVDMNKLTIVCISTVGRE